MLPQSQPVEPSLSECWHCLPQDDVILEITGTTVCGFDVHLYHGQIPDIRPGDILGHEFMGRVEKVGRNVTKLQPG